MNQFPLPYPTLMDVNHILTWKPLPADPEVINRSGVPIQTDTPNGYVRAVIKLFSQGHDG